MATHDFRDTMATARRVPRRRGIRKKRLEKHLEEYLEERLGGRNIGERRRVDTIVIGKPFELR
jgi:hypothetical protein